MEKFSRGKKLNKKDISVSLTEYQHAGFFFSLAGKIRPYVSIYDAVILQCHNKENIMEFTLCALMCQCDKCTVCFPFIISLRPSLFNIDEWFL